MDDVHLVIPVRDSAAVTVGRRFPRENSEPTTQREMLSNYNDSTEYPIVMRTGQSCQAEAAGPTAQLGVCA